MKKKAMIVLLSLFIINSCLLPTSNISTSKLNDKSISSNIKIDETKKVEIEILKYSNESVIDWYKKDANSLIMKVGSTARTIGTVTLKDGTKSSNVKWNSSDNTIANVNEGIIQANKIGKTTIVATSVLDSNYKGLLNVDVVDESNFTTENEYVKKVDAYVIIDKNIKSNNIQLSLGNKLKAYSTVIMSDGIKNSNVTWESSDENILKVTSDGDIIANKVGSASVIARYKLNPKQKGIIGVEVFEKLPNEANVLENLESDSSSTSEAETSYDSEQATPENNDNVIVIPTVYPESDSSSTSEAETSYDSEQATSENSTSEVSTDLVYNPAKVILSGIEIKESSGNGDNVPNRGEYISLIPKLINSGGVSTNSLHVKASSTNSYISFTSYDNDAYYNKIGSSTSGTPTSGSISATISKDTPANTTIPIIFTVTDSYGNEWDIDGSIVVR